MSRLSAFLKVFLCVFGLIPLVASLPLGMAAAVIATIESHGHLWWLIPCDLAYIAIFASIVVNLTGPVGTPIEHPAPSCHDKVRR